MEKTMISNFDNEKIYKDFNNPNKPYRYTVLDNFFTVDTANELCNSYPEEKDDRWYRFRGNIEGKKNVLEQGMSGISNKESMPKNWYSALLKINSDDFCKKLEQMTGISGLLPDSHNEIGHWAGLRIMNKGSYQLIHSDARLHPHLGIEKKLTLVGYFNENYDSKDEGCTEIWNDDMSKCIDKVEPLFNRVLLFENTEKSYHGVPLVNNYRKSFLASFLLKDDNFNETRPKALFVKRPKEKHAKQIDEIAEIRSKLKDY
tara:strand:+ start:338 stop:1114 length:777 start_codon:yes stop_codon:yes gene_type:complete